MIYDDMKKYINIKFKKNFCENCIVIFYSN